MHKYQRVRQGDQLCFLALPRNASKARAARLPRAEPASLLHRKEAPRGAVSPTAAPRSLFDAQVLPLPGAVQEEIAPCLWDQRAVPEPPLRRLVERPRVGRPRLVHVLGLEPRVVLWCSGALVLWCLLQCSNACEKTRTRVGCSSVRFAQRPLRAPATLHQSRSRHAGLLPKGTWLRWPYGSRREPARTTSELMRTSCEQMANAG